MTSLSATRTLRERLAEASSELLRLGSVPLRFRGIDSRYEYLDELELEFTFTESQITSFDPQTASDFLSYLGLWHAERLRLNLSRTDQGVLSGAWYEAREEFRRIFPGELFDETPVLAVLAGEPDWDVSEIILISTTLKPYVSLFSSRQFRHALLEVPTWFYRVLHHRITLAPPLRGEFPLSEPLAGLDADLREIVVALWEDSPSSEFHDLGSLRMAAVALR